MGVAQHHDAVSWVKLSIDGSCNIKNMLCDWFITTIILFTVYIWFYCYRGTEKQAVAYDYAMRLSRGNYECQVLKITCWMCIFVDFFFCRYMYLIVNQNLSLIDPLLQILLSYLMNLKEVFFFGPESGQWCLQETVSQTERGATKSDVL